ncbi:MAG: prepilin-type N-terminal cleavage/methylation domain-containing protein [Candidatus Omnitrophica bacterium]|jgi:prepilin-type N-terminal cleavage/methylation domain-containing protein|nr:prepilin-type N-terminal cleavage/methylation domain-containing protein [Candidatus Omnitrophota bacterium]
MMSSTGNKKKGFTLIEVLVTTAVLAFGIVSVFQALFIVMSGLNYISSYLNIVPAVDEKLWEVNDAIRRIGPGAGIARQGVFDTADGKYDWAVSVNPADTSADLYKVDLLTTWTKAGRSSRISRCAYVFYEPPIGK